MKAKNSRGATDARRRDFLIGSGAMLGAGWLAANLPLVAQAAQAAQSARAAGGAFENLTAEEAADLEAIAARIVPTDETPGATEAGVIWFIDQALGGFMAEAAPAFRDGLAGLNAYVAGQTGAQRFALLDDGTRDAVLRARQDTEFFENARFLTLAGLLTLPAYGGNRDHVGWKLIGFEHRHVWHPPFGFYDAQPAGEGDDRG